MSKRQKKPASKVPTVLRDTPPARNLAVVDGPQYGFKGPDGLHSLDDCTIVGIHRDLGRRLESANGGKYADQVMAATRLILCSNLERDFPGAVITAVLLNKNGDLAMKITGAPDGSISSDREFLQGRLDEACAKMAECLGV